MRKKHSTFSRLISSLDRGEFENINERHLGDHYTKLFSSWDYLVCMLHAIITSQLSLRTLEMNFNEARNANPIKRSTLSDANYRRGPGLY